MICIPSEFRGGNKFYVYHLWVNWLNFLFMLMFIISNNIFKLEMLKLILKINRMCVSLYQIWPAGVSLEEISEMLQGLETLWAGDRLGELGISSLEKGRLQGDPRALPGHGIYWFSVDQNFSVHLSLQLVTLHKQLGIVGHTKHRAQEIDQLASPS